MKTILLAIALTLGLSVQLLAQDLFPNPTGSGGCSFACLGGCPPFYLENDSCGSGCSVGPCSSSCCHRMSGYNMSMDGEMIIYLRFCDGYGCACVPLDYEAKNPSPYLTFTPSVLEPASIFTLAKFTAPNDTRITYVHGILGPDGKLQVTGHSVRVEKVNGDWETVFSGATRQTVTWGLNGKGAFRMDGAKQELMYLGPRPSGYMRHFNKNRLSNVSGEGTIAGQPVVKTKTELVEAWFGTNLNGALLYQNFDGDVMQAEKVEKGTFVLDPLPEYKVNNKGYENRLSLTKQQH